VSEGPVQYQLVDSAGELERLAGALARLPEFAVDLEGDYNLHRYGLHLCLVQIFDGQRCYLVDPLAIPRLDPLLELLGAPVVKVMFAPQSDLTLLDHLYGVPVKQVQDAQAAASLLGFDKLALGTVLSEVLGVRLPRGKGNQRANWGQRPLTPAMLEYAVHDVLHLLELNHQLWRQVARAGLELQLRQTNARLEQIRYRPPKDPHLRIRGARKLGGRARAILKHLFKARDRAARSMDWGPHRVLRNDALIRLAQNPPRRIQQWRRVEGMHPRARRYLELFQEAVAAADRELETLKV
jgi:ribonuclease D